MKKSLHAQIPIILGLKNLPDAVALPSHLELVSDPTRRSLPPETQIIDLFDAIGEGSRTMLILGQPGAGKTIALLQLAQVLLDRASEDDSQRIPVVLNLSSWAQEKKAIADWIVQELNSPSLYGVVELIGKVWVEQQELLLLLDGLDEIRDEGDRTACVKAINIFQQQYSTEIVVCCRIRDYKVLKTQLHFRRAVYLKHLTLLQIRDYLAQLGTEASGLKTLLVQDTELQKLARSPLMLNIIVLAYEGVAAEDIPEISPVSTRIQQLFDVYIDRMFRGSKQFAHQILPGHRQIQQQESYSCQQAKYWLVWLAKQMVSQSQTVFLIERMQPSLLNKSSYILYCLIVGISTGLGFGVSLGLITGLSVSLGFGLFFGLFSGLISLLLFGLFFGLFFVLTRIKLVESLDWSWKRFRKAGLTEGLIAALLVGSSFGIRAGLQEGLGIGIIAGVFFGLAIWLSCWLVLGLISGLDSKEAVVRLEPNQGIWKSLNNSLISGLIGGVVFSLNLGLVLGLTFSSNGLTYGIVVGLISGLIFRLLQHGGGACIQHFVLRCLLYRRSVIPWNYARFLNWASDKLFLQRVGGGYIFVHRLLMEHFAQMDLDEGRS